MRVLITGSRDWTNEAKIHNALLKVQEENEGPFILVSGACPTGADRMCERYAAQLGWAIEAHPAQWNVHGKRAGFLRNAEMVESKPDIALAFIRNESKGSTMTANLALLAGIPLEIYREEVG